jgi:uncharacterized protein YrzB (UPF0473 family)
MDEEKDIIELLDENGEQTRFQHVLTFLYEGVRYVALVPADEADDDEAEVVILRIEEKDGSDVYVTIDNEVLLDEVFNEFLDLIDEIEGEDSGDDGDGEGE